MTRRKPAPAKPAPAKPAPAPAEPPPLAHQFLWVDLETTGLDPDHGAILECAVLLADDAPGGDWTEVQSDVVTLRFRPRAAPWPIDPWVVATHARSGLWEACHDAPETADHAALDDFLVAVAKANGAPDGGRSIVLAGSSVHFDRAWLVRHCPRFRDYLSHRVLDVSTLKAWARAVYGPDGWTDPRAAQGDGEAEHRALADVRYSLAVARAFTGRFAPDRGRA